MLWGEKREGERPERLRQRDRERNDNDGVMKQAPGD